MRFGTIILVLSIGGCAKGNSSLGIEVNSCRTDVDSLQVTAVLKDGKTEQGSLNIGGGVRFPAYFAVGFSPNVQGDVQVSIMASLNGGTSVQVTCGDGNSYCAVRIEPSTTRKITFSLGGCLGVSGPTFDGDASADMDSIDSSLAPDAGEKSDMREQDMIVQPDMVTVADLLSPGDLGTSPDMVSGADLLALPDLSPVSHPDMTSPPDMTNLADLSPISYPDMLVLADFSPVPTPDMTEMPDMTNPADLYHVPPTPFQSCVSLSACAAGSCCESPLVPGGTFYRNFDVAGDGFSGTTNYQATISDFQLDKYHVTVGRFRNFLNAGYGTQVNPPFEGDGANLHIPGSGWQDAWDTNLPMTRSALETSLISCGGAGFNNWTSIAGANENKPINCLTWHEAFAFCIWDGGRLPTDAELNYAAAGGSEQRAFPWSNPASSLAEDPSDSNYTSLVMFNVGTLPNGNGKWGHSDLGGNAGQYVLDLFNSPLITPCTDCANLTNGTKRIFRGGMFSEGAGSGRTTDEGVMPLGFVYYGVGVRCARNP